MSEFISINKDNPYERHINKAIDIFKNKGIVIYPTDTIYGIGFTYSNKNGIDRIAKIKQKKVKNTEFSFIFSNISQIEQYTKPLDKWVFKLLKHNLPGPFTFILPAGSKILKELEFKRNSIGVRVPNNNIIRQIIDRLEEPILNSSIHDPDQIVEYTTDPELIFERYQHLVDMVIDGGSGAIEPSTVVDCTGNEPEIIRQGAGDLEF